MREKLIKKLFLVINNNIITNEKEEDFFSFFNNLFIKFHFLTKYSISSLLILIDFLSVIFFFKKFKNLTFEQSQFVINYLSKIKIFNKVISLIKVYSLIFIFSK